MNYYEGKELITLFFLDLDRAPLGIPVLICMVSMTPLPPTPPSPCPTPTSCPQLQTITRLSRHARKFVYVGYCQVDYVMLCSAPGNILSDLQICICNMLQF